MKKIASLIKYEWMTSFTFICFFYAIEYAIVIMLYSLVSMNLVSAEDVGISGLEINTMIFIVVVAIMGFYVDFKMLIQNGFTRKYIFISALSLFATSAGVMSLVDTIASYIMHYYNGYTSVFHMIYAGQQSLLHTWLLLFLVYFLVCSSTYFLVLLCHKMGRKLCVYVAVASIAMGTMMIPLLLKTTFLKDVMDKGIEIIQKSLGFMNDGTLNFMYPIASLVLLIGVVSTISYSIVRKTEI